MRSWFAVALTLLVSLFAGANTSGAGSTIIAWTNYAVFMTDPLAPAPADLTNAIAISVGNVHALALRADGTIRGWGSDSSGQIAMPSGLTNVSGISARGSHSLAVRQDGTVAAWGANDFGQTTLPASLNNVVTVAAGESHSLALKADGTVVAWGANYEGQTSVPPEALNVVAIAAGDNHSLALRGDGTVIAWGDQTNVPADLKEVAAIAAGRYQSLALKADGTVVAWMIGGLPGQTTAPPGLSNVVAIAAGLSQSLALKGDGSVVAWDDSGSIQTNLPPGLSNVVAMAVGELVGMAVIGSGPPVLTAPLLDRAAAAGFGTTFHAQAAGQWPLSYQWRFNGSELPDETNSTLRLMAAQSGQSGIFSVVVSNAFGVVVSSDAVLTVAPLLMSTPPQTAEVRQGGAAQLEVTVETSLPVVCQWRFEGADLPGMTNRTLLLSNVQPTQVGAYSVTVSNAFGSVVSPAASLAFRLLTAWGNGLTDVPPGLTDVVAISAGGAHSLALRRNGTVAAWGTDYNGDSTVPAGLSNVVALAGGGYHSLALKADGTVVAWGDDVYGQTEVPPDLAGVVAIAAGFYDSLALKADGSVVAWGNAGSLEPGVPQGLADVVAIADHVALRADGSTISWGFDSGASGFTDLVAIAGRASEGLGLRADGTVVVWGYNLDAETNMVASLSNVLAIAAGDWHRLALKADGTVVAWGANDAQQAHVPAGLSNAVAIAAGGSHSLALAGYGPPFLTTPLIARTAAKGMTSEFRIAATGTWPMTYQWRLNGVSLLGATNASLTLSDVGDLQAGAYSVVVSNRFGAVESPEAPLALSPLLIRVAPQSQICWEGESVELSVAADSSLPVAYQWRFNGAELVGKTNALLVLTGLKRSQAGAYSVAVSNSFGEVSSREASLAVLQVVAWGQNDYRQTDPQPLLSNVVSVAAGEYHSLALKADGTLAAWGLNQSGDSQVPPELTNVIAVAAGRSHSLVLQQDSTVFGWGDNTSGQIQVPPDLSDVAAIAAGGLTSLALTKSGRVIAWGDNSFGEASVPPDLGSVVAVACGGAHSLALRADGAVMAWGAGFYRQTNVPPGLSNAVAIAAGEWHSLALTADGTVTAWGDITYGQVNVPAGLTNVVAIAAGGVHSLALTEDGTVVSWGALSGEVPAGLLDVVQVSGGEYHSLALAGYGPPFLTTPLVSRSAAIGTSVPLRIEATGSRPLRYQWRLEGTNLPGATNPVVLLSEVQPAQAGGYSVVVSNQFGRATSSVAMVSVAASLILLPPQDQLTWRGSTVSFTVEEQSTVPVSYRWQYNGIDIPGAIDSTLSLTEVRADQAGYYSVVVANSYGSVTSAVARLEVRIPGPFDIAIRQDSGTAIDLYGIAYGNGLLVAVGYYGTILSSPDGRTWIRQNTPTFANLHGVAFANGGFVAVGNQGTILDSPDGIAWSLRPSGTTRYLKNVTWANGLYVAVGSHGTILTSVDGKSWAGQWSGTIGDLNSVSYAHGFFVVVGDQLNNNATFLISANGLFWSVPNALVSKNVRSVTSGEDVFVAVGNDGAIASSSDGVNWNSMMATGPCSSNNLRAVTFANGVFTAVGNSGTVLSSTDGANWDCRESGTLNNLHNVTYGGGVLVAVGSGGMIVKSDSFVPARLTLRGRPTTEGLELLVFGEAGRSYRVQATTDRAGAAWVDLFSFSNPQGTTTLFLDSRANHFPSRFYRVVSP